MALFSAVLTIKHSVRLWKEDVVSPHDSMLPV